MEKVVVAVDGRNAEPPGIYKTLKNWGISTGTTLLHHAAPQGGVTEIAATEPAVPSVEIIDDGPSPTAGQPVPPGGWMVGEPG